MAAKVDVADAFDVFYCRHRVAVLTYLVSRTPDIGTAVDLLAEVFAAAYLDRTGFASECGSARVWLFDIADVKVSCLSRWRRRAARLKLGIKPRRFTEKALEDARGRVSASALLAGLPTAEHGAVQPQSQSPDQTEDRRSGSRFELLGKLGMEPRQR